MSCLGFVPPPLPTEPSCATQQWWAHALDAALGSSSLYFVGDSISAQQWRALLCAERERVDPKHASFGPLMLAAKLNIPKGPAGSDVLCVPLRPRDNRSSAPSPRICYARASSLGSLFEAAARVLSEAPPRAVVHLNGPYGHDASPEGAYADALLSLLSRRPPPAHVRVVWRTREADHFGPRGYTGPIQGACLVATAEQRAAPEGSLEPSRREALRRAGVLVYDGAEATIGAHGAHPHRGCVGGNGSYADCRHFCQPGPIDAWNVQLVSALSAGWPSYTGAYRGGFFVIGT